MDVINNTIYETFCSLLNLNRLTIAIVSVVTMFVFGSIVGTLIDYADRFINNNTNVQSDDNTSSKETLETGESKESEKNGSENLNGGKSSISNIKLPNQSIKEQCAECIVSKCKLTDDLSCDTLEMSKVNNKRENNSISDHGGKIKNDITDPKVKNDNSNSKLNQIPSLHTPATSINDSCTSLTQNNFTTLSVKTEDNSNKIRPSCSHNVKYDSQEQCVSKNKTTDNSISADNSYGVHNNHGVMIASSKKKKEINDLNDSTLNIYGDYSVIFLDKNVEERIATDGGLLSEDQHGISNTCKKNERNSKDINNTAQKILAQPNVAYHSEIKAYFDYQSKQLSIVTKDAVETAIEKNINSQFKNIKPVNDTNMGQTLTRLFSSSVSVEMEELGMSSVDEMIVSENGEYAIIDLHGEGYRVNKRKLKELGNKDDIRNSRNLHELFETLEHLDVVGKLNYDEVSRSVITCNNNNAINIYEKENNPTLNNGSHTVAIGDHDVITDEHMEKQTNDKVLNNISSCKRVNKDINVVDKTDLRTDNILPNEFTRTGTNISENTTMKNEQCETTEFKIADSDENKIEQSNKMVSPCKQYTGEEILETNESKLEEMSLVLLQHINSQMGTLFSTEDNDGTITTLTSLRSEPTLSPAQFEPKLFFATDTKTEKLNANEIGNDEIVLIDKSTVTPNNSTAINTESSNIREETIEHKNNNNQSCPNNFNTITETKLELNEKIAHSKIRNPKHLESIVELDQSISLHYPITNVVIIKDTVKSIIDDDIETVDLKNDALLKRHIVEEKTDSLLNEETNSKNIPLEKCKSQLLNEEENPTIGDVTEMSDQSKVVDKDDIVLNDEKSKEILCKIELYCTRKKTKETENLNKVEAEVLLEIISKIEELEILNKVENSLQTIKETKELKSICEIESLPEVSSKIEEPKLLDIIDDDLETIKETKELESQSEIESLPEVSSKIEEPKLLDKIDDDLETIKETKELESQCEIESLPEVSSKIEEPKLLDIIDDDLETIKETKELESQSEIESLPEVSSEIEEPKLLDKIDDNLETIKETKELESQSEIESLPEVSSKIEEPKLLDKIDDNLVTIKETKELESQSEIESLPEVSSKIEEPKLLDKIDDNLVTIKETKELESQCEIENLPEVSSKIEEPKLLDKIDDNLETIKETKELESQCEIENLPEVSSKIEEPEILDKVDDNLETIKETKEIESQCEIENLPEVSSKIEEPEILDKVKNDPETKKETEEFEPKCEIESLEEINKIDDNPETIQENEIWKISDKIKTNQISIESKMEEFITSCKINTISETIIERKESVTFNECKPYAKNTIKDAKKHAIKKHFVPKKKHESKKPESQVILDKNRDFKQCNAFERLPNKVSGNMATANQITITTPEDKSEETAMNKQNLIKKESDFFPTLVSATSTKIKSHKTKGKQDLSNPLDLKTGEDKTSANSVSNSFINKIKCVRKESTDHAPMDNMSHDENNAADVIDNIMKPSDFDFSPDKITFVNPRYYLYCKEKSKSLANLNNVEDKIIFRRKMDSSINKGINFVNETPLHKCRSMEIKRKKSKIILTTSNLKYSTRNNDFIKSIPSLEFLNDENFENIDLDRQVFPTVPQSISQESFKLRSSYETDIDKALNQYQSKSVLKKWASFSTSSFSIDAKLGIENKSWSNKSIDAFSCDQILIPEHDGMSFGDDFVSIYNDTKNKSLVKNTDVGYKNKHSDYINNAFSQSLNNDDIEETVTTDVEDLNQSYCNEMFFDDNFISSTDLNDQFSKDFITQHISDDVKPSADEDAIYNNVSQYTNENLISSEDNLYEKAVGKMGKLKEEHENPVILNSPSLEFYTPTSSSSQNVMKINLNKDKLVENKGFIKIDKPNKNARNIRNNRLESPTKIITTNPNGYDTLQYEDALNILDSTVDGEIRNADILGRDSFNLDNVGESDNSHERATKRRKPSHLENTIHSPLMGVKSMPTTPIPRCKIKKHAPLAKSNSWQYCSDYSLTSQTSHLIKSIEDDIMNEYVSDTDENQSNEIRKTIEKLRPVKTKPNDSQNKNKEKYLSENSLIVKKRPRHLRPSTFDNKRLSKSLHDIFTGKSVETDIDEIDEMELTEALNSPQYRQSVPDIYETDVDKINLKTTNNSAPSLFVQSYTSTSPCPKSPLTGRRFIIVSQKGGKFKDRKRSTKSLNDEMVTTNKNNASMYFFKSAENLVRKTNRLSESSINCHVHGQVTKIKNQNNRDEIQDEVFLKQTIENMAYKENPKTNQHTVVQIPVAVDNNNNRDKYIGSSESPTKQNNKRDSWDVVENSLRRPFLLKQKKEISNGFGKQKIVRQTSKDIEKGIILRKTNVQDSKVKHQSWNILELVRQATSNRNNNIYHRDSSDIGYLFEKYQNEREALKKLQMKQKRRDSCCSEFSEISYLSDASSDSCDENTWFTDVMEMVVPDFEMSKNKRLSNLQSINTEVESTGFFQPYTNLPSANNNGHDEIGTESEQILPSPTEPNTVIDISSFNDEGLSQMVLNKAASAVRSRRRSSRRKNISEESTIEAETAAKHQVLKSKVACEMKTLDSGISDGSNNHSPNLKCKVTNNLCPSPEFKPKRELCSSPRSEMKTLENLAQESVIPSTASINSNSSCSNVNKSFKYSHSISDEKTISEFSRSYEQVHSLPNLHFTNGSNFSSEELNFYDTEDFQSESSLLSDSCFDQFEGSVYDDELFIYPSLHIHKNSNDNSRVQMNCESSDDESFDCFNTSLSESMNVDDNTTIERTVCCGYPPCSKQQLMKGKQRSTFTSCPSCFTCYCSRACRRKHWHEHKRICFFGRISYYIRSLIRRCEKEEKFNERLKCTAVENYKTFGRGYLSITFDCATDAKIALVSKNTVLDAPPVYNNIESICGQNNRHTYLLNQNLIDYDPEQEFVVSISIVLASKTHNKKKQSTVVRSARISMLTPLTPLYDNVSDSYVIRTFTLPYLDEEFNDRETRRFYCRELSFSLKRCGVKIKNEYSDAYEKLCAYVDKELSFVPLVLYGKKERTYKCIIYPSNVNRVSQERGEGILV